MKKLVDIYNKLGIDDRIIKVYSGKIVPPDFFFFNKPVETFARPFPPFFIPMFVFDEADFYIGIVNHFFTDRQKVYCRFDLENGYMLEVARTNKQFLIEIQAESIDFNEGMLNDEIRLVAQKLQLNDDLLEQLSANYVNEMPYFHNFKNFEYLDEFLTKMPGSLYMDEGTYNGDFPTSKSEINFGTIHKASEFEISKAVQMERVDSPPDWLREDVNKQELFKKYISENDYEKAWFTLNSKNWSYRNVVNGLQILKEKNPYNELFNLITDLWITEWEKSEFNELGKIMY